MKSKKINFLYRDPVTGRFTGKHAKRSVHEAWKGHKLLNKRKVPTLKIRTYKTKEVITFPFAGTRHTVYDIGKKPDFVKVEKIAAQNPKAELVSVRIKYKDKKGKIQIVNTPTKFIDDIKSLSRSINQISKKYEVKKVLGMELDFIESSMSR